MNGYNTKNKIFLSQNIKNISKSFNFLREIKLKTLDKFFVF